jgi:predicted Zn-dependent protease
LVRIELFKLGSRGAIGYGGAIMPQSHHLRAAAAGWGPTTLLAVLILTGCATPAPKAPPEPAGTDSNAAVVVAELALQRGQCRESAEAYAKAAAASPDVALATRATQVAMGCEQLEPALRAAARWQQLAPGRGEQALARALVAMKLYQVEEARKALTQWRDSGAAGNQDPGRFADLLENETETTIAYRLYGDVLLGEDPTPDVLLAEATLALRAYDWRRAVELSQRALELETGLVPARLIQIRARALLGEADAALAAATEIQGQLSGEDAFIVADVLSTAQRVSAAREELLRLRQNPQLAAAAARRLGALALDQGDLDEAEKQFTAIVGTRGSTTVAMLYLAQIFDRRGDTERALRTYALLADSTVSLAARSGAARLLLRAGKRTEALALVDAYQKEHPESAIEAIIARAQLFAGNGDPLTALALLEAALKDYPSHPQLDYQRATMLERAGRHGEAERAFEQLLKRRPEDPGITNALGFTLADHNRSLDRAEKLVREALAQSPDNPAIQDSLGWVRYRRGQLADAAQTLETAWRNGRDAEIGAHFGEVLWKKGDEGRARYVWQQALNLDPDNALVRATLARLTGEEAPAGHR